MEIWQGRQRRSVFCNVPDNYFKTIPYLELAFYYSIHVFYPGLQQFSQMITRLSSPVDIVEESRIFLAGILIKMHRRRCGSVIYHVPVGEHDPTLTKRCDHGHAVAYKDDRPAIVIAHILHFSEAFLLEFRIADCEHLIDDQDLRLQKGGYCKGKAHIHPGRISFHRRIDIPLNAGKIDDLVEFPSDLSTGHAKDGAVQEDIIPTTQFR